MGSETRTCQNCKQDFRIEPEDFDFYKKMDVPPPTFCPQCRLQRRLVWRNERTLYKRICDLCSKSIISMYPANSEFPVYCRECWFSDKWDPLMYGSDYDFQKPFFEQFRELLSKTPRIAVQVDKGVNCDYTNQIFDCKNCYLIFSVAWAEDSYYSYRINNSKGIFDSLLLEKAERCYEALECRDSAGLHFSQNVADGYDLKFCYDLNGSNNSFMSSNKRRASYFFKNQALSKEEYAKEMERINTGSYVELLSLKEEFKEMYAKSIHKFANFKNIVNSVGHAFSYAKNSFYCFYGADLENCRYMFFVNNGKDAMDINNGHFMELCYENSTNGAGAYNVKFSIDAWPDIRNAEYCDSCRSGASNLFGCVSIRQKQYCILNKQYSKEEYEALLPRIKAHMTTMPYIDNRNMVYKYGEFFPAEIALFGYNETMAYDWFPLSRTEVEGNGWRWVEEPDRHTQIDFRTEEIPDRIQDASDEMAGKILACAHGGTCGQKCTIGFRMVPDELQFLKAQNIALPRLCPNCRHYERLARMQRYRLYDRQCMCKMPHQNHPDGACQNRFQTPYPTGSPEIVYCESCYNAEVA